MAAVIEALNGPDGLQLLGPNIQLLDGGNCMMGLGSSLTDAEINEMGKSLAPQTQTGGGVDDVRLAALMSNYDQMTQAKLGAAIISAGGSDKVVSGALKMLKNDSWKADKRWGAFLGILSTASAAASAYHGYKRNDSVGWAVVWFLMGGLFPVITPAVALAQGFGKPKGD
jgi:hypothetical protein